jgi:maltose alpha-D-glucosyltransferase/alpha-amylase
LPIILDPEYHYETVNVEAQQRNPHSLLWWTKRLLALRKRWKALGQGTLQFLQPENRKVLAFLREFDGERILVVANLSRFPQPVGLDLASFTDSIPVELFGRTEFPPITDKPYALTLSPHSVFWLALEKGSTHGHSAAPGLCETLTVAEDWAEVLEGEPRRRLEGCLPSYVKERRWFGGKTKDIKSMQIRDAIPIFSNGDKAFLALLGVEYVQGDPEEYLLPLAFSSGPGAEHIQRDLAALVIARVQITQSNTEGILHDGTGSASFGEALFEAIARRRTCKGLEGVVEAWPTHELRLARGSDKRAPQAAIPKAEQSNTALVFGDQFFLKLFRRLEPGINPDLEMSRFLAEKNFPNVPALAGALEYQRPNADLLTLGVMSRYFPAAKDAWEHTLDTLSRYFERVRTLPQESRVIPAAGGSLLDLAQQDIPAESSAVVGTFLESARLLGQRTGEMHLALASDSENKDFAPEPFTPFYQRALYQSMRNLVVQSFQLLRRRLSSVSGSVRPLAEKVAGLEGEILKRLRAVYETRISAQRIRCHGDFHLGQVLYTGKDFIIIDFEGEPARPLGERRIKRSPLRDVAGMIRSFDYVADAALFRQIELGALEPEQIAQLEPWTRFWYNWIAAAYLRAYLNTVQNSDLLPKSPAATAALLNAYLLEKAVYEVTYELNNRPDWVRIPLQGISQLLEPGKSS